MFSLFSMQRTNVQDQNVKSHAQDDVAKGFMIVIVLWWIEYLNIQI